MPSRSCLPLSALLAVPLIACGPGGAGDGDDEAATDPSETTDTGGDESGTTTTTTSTSTTGTETGVDTDPLPDMEGGGPQACDPWTQDCAEGEKCVPYSSNGDPVWDDHKCVPVTGDGQPGEPCVYAGVVEAADDCGADSYCWNVQDVDGELVGVCTPICTGSPGDPQCPDNYSCLISGAISLCTYDCDPLVQDCADGLGCYWANNSFECVPTGADLGTGEPCTTLNDCAPQALCAGAEYLPDCAGEGCCTLFCDTLVDFDPCPGAYPGTMCVSFFEAGMAPPGYENLGVCISMMP